MAAVKNFPAPTLLKLSLAEQEYQNLVGTKKIGFPTHINIGADHFRNGDYVRAFTWWANAAEMNVPPGLTRRSKALADSMWSRISAEAA